MTKYRVPKRGGGGIREGCHVTKTDFKRGGLLERGRGLDRAFMVVH